MRLEVVTSCGQRQKIEGAQAFEQLFAVRYVPALEYASAQVQRRLERRYEKAQRKGWITAQQKWLGAYLGGREAELELAIVWIDARVGYGVWTQREIGAGAYVGEYAGVLRRRQFWSRWDNLYCFEYRIGKGTSYVIDAQDASNYTRFINHSFEPNVEPLSVDYGGQIHVIFRAKHPIPAGTQLCYDYGDEYWRKRSQPLSLTT